MGTQLYGRYVDLTVAPIGGAPGVRVRDLRVAFEAKKTSTSAANEGTVEVYNLSPQSRTAIDRKGQGVVLKAGYQDVNGTLLAGDLRRVEHRREGVDVISRMEVRDGGAGLYGSRFSGSYKAGTSRLAVIRDLVGALSGVDLGLVSATGLRGTTDHRLALHGLARVCLDKVCRAWGVEFSVQDGAAQFLDPTGTRGGGTLAIKLTPQTGLIGSPAKTQSGVRGTCLLRADMLPGSYLVLDSTELCNGSYRVQSLSHAGDTRGAGQWLTTFEAVRL